MIDYVALLSFGVGFVIQLLVYAYSQGRVAQKLNDLKEDAGRRLGVLEDSIGNLPCKTGSICQFPKEGDSK